MLGKMLKITRLPAMSLLPMSCNALVVNENFGNVLPVAGNLPLTETGLPPNVTVEPDFFADFFLELFATFFPDFFADFFFDFFAAFFLVFFFDAMSCFAPNLVVGDF